MQSEFDLILASIRAGAYDERKNLLKGEMTAKQRLIKITNELFLQKKLTGDETYKLMEEWTKRQEHFN